MTPILTYDLAIAMHADRLRRAAARHRDRLGDDPRAHLRTQVACLIVRSIRISRRPTQRDLLVAAACGCP